MLAVAAVGLGINLFVASWLRREQKTNLNVRSAFWHALGDALASVGVIVGAVIIMLTGLVAADPIISIVIGLIIVLAAWSIFRDGLRVLLEASPKQIDVRRLVKDIGQIPGVKGVHDIHVWSITPELHAMSCHILIDDLSASKAARIREQTEELLGRYNIEHTTLQMEYEQCRANDMFCTMTAFSDEETKPTKD